MDKTAKQGLRQNSEDIFLQSLSLERDSIERELLFFASQLVEMALELIGEKEDA